MKHEKINERMPGKARPAVADEARFAGRPPAAVGGLSASPARAGVRVDRAITELRRGRPVRLTAAGGEQILVVAVETMLPSSWAELTASGGELNVTLTAERAHASGWSGSATADTAVAVVALPTGAGLPGAAVADEPAPLLPITLTLPAGFEPGGLADLAGLGLLGGEGIGEFATVTLDGEGAGRAAGPAQAGITGIGRWNGLLAVQSASPAAQTTPAMRAALELARLARLIPAVVTHALAGEVSAGPSNGGRSSREQDGDPDHLRVSAADVVAYPSDRASSLLRVSEAPVPLAGHENSRFVLFRETVADLEHIAIIIGNPDRSSPVLVRLHSSCLTGDLFASLRCDCGDQLRGAINRLGEGGGVLLYLAQEGRGIGLANKLRAYASQDTGLDTIDADRYLGFRGDERNFGVAVQMLKVLGIARIRLLTNNPAKIAALRQAGLDVVERLPIGGQVNRHNERYIATKRDRAGHLIDVSAVSPARQAI